MEMLTAGFNGFFGVTLGFSQCSYVAKPMLGFMMRMTQKCHDHEFIFQGLNSAGSHRIPDPAPLFGDPAPKLGDPLP